MKRYILSIMLAVIFMPAFAVAQEEGPEDIEFQEFQMEMHERKMELQHREAQMDIERRMQELELDRRKIELEREKPKDIEFQMEMRKREMELQQREVDMDIERRMQEKEMELRQRKVGMDAEQRMQELELEKRKLDIEGHRIKLDHERKDHKEHKDGPHPLLFLVLVVHILCAVWVYQDIRRRNAGSGIWIVIALLTGLLGTLVYAVVRIGESQKSPA